MTQGQYRGAHALLVATAALLFSTPALAEVVINEIHYHPANAAVQAGEDAEGLQFIELYNTGPDAADLSGASFGGLTFTFPADTTLAAGAYLVVTQDIALLRARGPAIPDGVAVFQWAGGVLDNGGERISLSDAGASLLDEVRYDDSGQWPLGADGTGPSLELTNPAYDNSEPLTWRDSQAANGTPGAPNSAFTEGPVIVREAPTRGTIVGDSLVEVAITFASPVTGVAAADLVVDGAPAAAVVCDTCVAGVGAGPWVFTGFPLPQTNPTEVTLAAGNIQDEAGHPFAGDTWLYPLSVPRVVINEVHYNPASATDDEEFIELLNADADAVDLSGWRIVEFGSPGCTFPGGTVLQPGEFAVCARNPAALSDATGFITDVGWGDGDSLSNGGEPIAVFDQYGTIVDRIEYDDAAPWPAGAPDGDGPSIELINPGLDNALGGSWRASAAVNGTPGAQNTAFVSAPALATVLPARGSIVADLQEIQVTFSDPVVGVTPDLLTVGPLGGPGVPAVAVAGNGAGPYVFTIADPGTTVIEVVLAPGDIQNAGGTAFEGDRWLYFTELPQLVINEIHYHPAAGAAGAELDGEEVQFVELYNAGDEDVDLSGFEITNGFDFVFPDGASIAAGGFLVLTANADALRASVGVPDGVPVFTWAGGSLSNGGETLEISDAYGHELDRVAYDDDGEWTDAPDGNGPSLELINPAMPNGEGGAWRASAAANGTPGAPNSSFVENPAPIVFSARHEPPLPLPNQMIAISARVIDDGEAPPTVTLYYREDRDPPIPYESTQMFDDGEHGDGAAGDGRFGVMLPGLANEAQLDFYMEASDGVGTTTAPAGHTVPDDYGMPSQTFLAKFTNEVLKLDAVTFHIIVTRFNKRQQEALVGYPTRKKKFDATFVTGAGDLWYNVTERYRGQSSLSRLPSSYRVDFPSNRKLQSPLGWPTDALQLTADRPHSQFILFALFNEAGLPAPRASYAHVRYTGINYDDCCDGQHGYWGLHTVVERLGNSFLDSQGGAVNPPRRTSSEGNLYRGRNDGDMRWEGTNPATYMVNANGQAGYEKYNNEEEDFWDDLIALCDAVSNTPDEHYVEHVEAHLDVDNWAQYFALHMLLNNKEGGFYRDTGDDYFFYIPPVGDPQNPVHPDYGTAQLPDSRLSGKTQLVTWDGDSTFIGGDETIWRTRVAAPARFLRHNAYAPIFVKAVEDFAATVFSPENVDRIIDGMPDGFFAQAGGNINDPRTKEQFKEWHRRRLQFVANETVDALTLVGGPDFVHEGPAPIFPLNGQLQQAGTHNVTVNGVQTTYSVFNATWSYDLPLELGRNEVLIEAWDRAGNVKESIAASVFYNPVDTPDEMHLAMRAPRRMLADKTLTIDAAIQDPVGRIRYQVWDELGTVSVVRLPERTPVAITSTVFDDHVPVLPGTLRFQNGWGSLSFTLDEGANFAPGEIEVTVSWGELSASRVVEVVGQPQFRNISGNIVGANLVWGPDEIIRVTGSATVAQGSTLTIHPGTLVQVNTTGNLENGTVLNINGELRALGTRDNPIHFFSERGADAMWLTQQGSASNANAWRGIFFNGGGSSVLRQVFLTGAGNGSIQGHPRPPILLMRNTHSLLSDRNVFADNCGMIFSGGGTGNYTVRKTLVNRVGIGAEFNGNGHTLRISDSWFTSIGHAPEANNRDGDLLHIDGSNSDQIIRSSVVQDGGDDGIDHSGSTFRVEHSILWGIRDKAISMTGGHADVHNTLIFRSATGIRGFAQTSYTTIATGRSPPSTASPRPSCGPRASPRAGTASRSATPSSATPTTSAAATGTSRRTLSTPTRPPTTTTRVPAPPPSPPGPPRAGSAGSASPSAPSARRTPTATTETAAPPTPASASSASSAPWSAATPATSPRTATTATRAPRTSVSPTAPAPTRPPRTGPRAATASPAPRPTPARRGPAAAPSSAPGARAATPTAPASPRPRAATQTRTATTGCSATAPSTATPTRACARPARPRTAPTRWTAPSTPATRGPTAAPTPPTTCAATTATSAPPAPVTRCSAARRPTTTRPATTRTRARSTTCAAAASATARGSCPATTGSTAPRTAANRASVASPRTRAPTARSATSGTTCASRRRRWWSSSRASTATTAPTTPSSTPVSPTTSSAPRPTSSRTGRSPPRSSARS